MEKLVRKENKIMQQESNHMFQDFRQHFLYRLKKNKKQINFQINKLNNYLAKAER
jgi:hypothetical protein